MEELFKNLDLTSLESHCKSFDYFNKKLYEFVSFSYQINSATIIFSDKLTNELIAVNYNFDDGLLYEDIDGLILYFNQPTLSGVENTNLFKEVSSL